MANTKISQLTQNASPPNTGRVVYYNPSSGNDETATIANIFTTDQAVSSVFGRTGTVTALLADYSSFYVQTGGDLGGSTAVPTVTATHLGSALPTLQGGTGQTSYTNGQLLIGNTAGNTLSLGTLTAGSGISVTTGTGTISIAASGLTNSNLSGSAGITNANLANSSVTVTPGTGLSGGGAVSLGSAVTLTNAGVTSITGTANQITASASTGAVTLSTPQNIHTGASPTFVGLTLSGNEAITVANNGNVQALTITQNDTTNNPRAVNITNAGTGAGLFITQSGNGIPINIQNSGSGRVEVTRTVGGVNNFNPVLYVQASSASETIGGLQVVIGNAGASGYGISISNAGTGPSFIINTGPSGFGLSSPLSTVHIKAGSATANTAPLQFNSGTLETTARVGVEEYNGNHYLTNAGPLRFSIGGTLFDHFADVGNTHTDGVTFDDIYTDTTVANTLNANGDKIRADYSGIFVSSATASREIKVLFAGTTILDTGALTTATAESFDIDVLIIRESSSVVRCMATIWSSTILGAGAFTDTTYTRITGLTLSGTNILKVQAVSGGAGAAASDIVGKLGTIQFVPAA